VGHLARVTAPRAWAAHRASRAANPSAERPATSRGGGTPCLAFRVGRARGTTHALPRPKTDRLAVDGQPDRRLWKRLGSIRRKETAAALARRIPESAAFGPNRRPTEASGSSLLAHGMQEVVGSSPTSSTGNGLQSGRFGRAAAERGAVGKRRWKRRPRRGAFLCLQRATDPGLTAGFHTTPRRARWCFHAGPVA